MSSIRKIVEINACSYGSTGNIEKGISEVAESGGGFSVSCYSAHDYSKKFRDKPVCPDGFAYIGSFFERKIHNLFGRITGIDGIMTFIGTKRFLKSISQEKIDIIHLHNLHGYCINIPLIFRYIKKNNIPVVWTLHDCWSFTGHCPYFDMARCEKWETECNHCPQLREYPQSLLDSSRLMYHLKKKWFTGVQNMTIVTPSQWLADLVKQSFLKNYPVKVINNGIDLNVFQPREPSSGFLEKNAKLKEWLLTNGRLNTEKRVPGYLILGVAFDWGRRKGLDVFIELAKRLTNNYQIVLVGTDDNIDEQLPKNIISIHKTSNQQELAEIYSLADLFVNPTREEVFGMVNVEALACGTPVLTYNTGGSPECVDKTCGSVVDCNDVDGLQAEIIKICEKNSFSKEACVRRAKCFDEIKKFAEYLLLYRGALK